MSPFSYEIDCKLIRRDKEGHFILSKGIVNQEVNTILNILFTKPRGAQFSKQSTIGINNTE